MSARAWARLRGVALLALGALAVHQLRYLLAFRDDAGAALHREGHGYLAELIPVLVAFAAAGLAASLAAGILARGAGRGRVITGPGRAVLYGVALFAVFVTQELAEGALFAGHPAGLAAIVGGGAWLAAPLALAFGALAALAERLLDRAEGAIAGRLRRPGAPAEAPDPASPAARPAWRPLAAAPLAFGLARRPPPLAS